VATEDQHNENKAPPSLSDRGVARRRLVKAGAGVLLTLEARASLASPVCATPSGYLSGGLHNSHYGPQTCNGGYGPGYWKKEDRAWPKGLDRATLAFTTVFPVAGSCQMKPAPSNPGEPKDYTGGNANAHHGNPNANGNASGNGKGKGNGQGFLPLGDQSPSNPSPGTMVPVPSYQCALLDEVHMAATYLNICAGHIDFLTVDRLQEIWVEVSTTGVYKPTAGVTWSREELKEYFKATMHPD
jgi:hypothetical protein